MSGSLRPTPPTIAGPGTHRLVVGLAGLTLGWVALYLLNERLWEPLLDDLLGVDPSTRAGDAVRFLLYDVSKIMLLLVGMIFAVGLVRTTLRPERVRDFLEGKPLYLALLLAAVVGSVTPFCSCSSIPLFIGFVAAGVPLSVTFAFLIASPLVNEVAVVMMADAFGWRITVGYVVAGLTIAVVAGWVFSRFPLRGQVEEFVWTAPIARLQRDGRRPTLEERVEAARDEVREIFGRVWKWVIIGVGIGALVHGWVPESSFERFAGADNPLAVLGAALVGVPLYSNAAGVVPIGEALYGKGAALGTVMAFMMATVALSLPEAVLLRRVLKPRLLAAYFGAVAVGILIVGVLFNTVT